MKTLRIRYTRPDYATQAGGIILRERTEEPRFIVHYFNRERGTLDPTCFHEGGYHSDRLDAELDFDRRMERAKRYDTGGSLISNIDTEIAKERGQ